MSDFPGQDAAIELYATNPTLWCKLAEQAFVLADYLTTYKVTGTDEDEIDPVTRACRHVAMLAGYRGDAQHWVAVDLSSNVRLRVSCAGRTTP